MIYMSQISPLIKWMGGHPKWKSIIYYIYQIEPEK